MAKRKRPLAERVRNAVWPRMGLRRYVTYLKNKVLRLSAGPHAIAAGFASGAAVSIFPFIGLHFVLGFVLAFVVRGNMLAAALGTAVGNPLTFPIIFSATYSLGNVLFGFFGSSQAPAELADAQAAEILDSGFSLNTLDTLLPAIKTMSVGAIPLSLLTFGIFYVLVRGVVMRFRIARQNRRARRGETELAE